MKRVPVNLMSIHLSWFSLALQYLLRGIRNHTAVLLIYQHQTKEASQPILHAYTCTVECYVMMILFLLA